MYCGCNPIALSSQTQISEALLRLMMEKSYSEITVSELCRESGVSRQTFYSLFRSMENVVLFTLQERLCALPHASGAAVTLEQLCRCYSSYISENREYLKLLVENNVAYLLYDSICESLLCCREHALCPGTAYAARREYAVPFLAGGLTGVVRQYCTAEPPPSADALYEILCALLGGEGLR